MAKVYAKTARTVKGKKVYRIQKTRRAEPVEVSKKKWDTYEVRGKPAAKTVKTTDPRKVTAGKKAAGREVRGLRSANRALGKSAATAGKFGGKIGAGISGGIVGMILASMMGGNEKSKQPELPMGLMQLAGQSGGDGVSNTLKEVARLVSILKGAQNLAGMVAPPPLQAVQNQNPFSAAGLIA